VATKVVVIIENQDARVGVLLAVEVRGRETADASAHDDEVVDVCVGFAYRPPVALTIERELMGDFERAPVTAA